MSNVPHQHHVPVRHTSGSSAQSRPHPQRSQFMISQLRKEIESINRIIGQSRLLINDSSSKAEQVRRTPQGIKQSKEVQNSPWSAFSRDRGYEYNCACRNVYSTPDRNIRIETTSSATGNHNPPKVNVKISYDDPYVYRSPPYNPTNSEHIASFTQIPQSRFYNPEPKTQSSQSLLNRKQLEIKEKELQMQRKRRLQLEAQLNQNSVQNKTLRLEIKEMERKSSLEEEKLREQLRSFEGAHKRIKQSKEMHNQSYEDIQRSKVVQSKPRKYENSHKRATSDVYTKKLNINSKKTNQDLLYSKNRQRSISSSNLKPFSYLQKQPELGDFPRAQNKNAFKEDRHKTLILNLGSSSVKKKQPNDTKDDHPYLSRHGWHLKSDSHVNFSSQKKKPNYNNRLSGINNSSHLEHSVSKSKQDSDFSNEKLKELCVKRLEKLQKEKRGIDRKMGSPSTHSNKRTNIINSKQRSNVSKDNQKRNQQQKTEKKKYILPSGHKYDQISSRTHNCSVDGIKTSLDDMLLPERAPTRQEFKTAVLRHYVVERYLDDKDLNEVYTQVCHGKVPKHNWPVLAMDLAFLKVHRSTQSQSSLII